MKYAVTVGYNNAHKDALVLFRGVEENLSTIAEMGYHGIELAIYDQSNIHDVAGLKRTLAGHGLELPVISTGQVFTMRNVHFLSDDAEVRKEAVRIVSGIIDIAGEFESAVNISRVRGSVPEGLCSGDAKDRLLGCLGQLCRKADKAGITLVLEQMNRYETNYLLSVQDVGEFIRASGLPALRIHADTFHMNIEDADMIAAIEQNNAVLGYIHFADSNRLAPGWGHIDFAAIQRCLETVGYEGWIGIEVLRQPDSVSAARQAINHLKKACNSVV